MIEYSTQPAASTNNLALQLRLFLLSQSRHLYISVLHCSCLCILRRLSSNHLSQLFARIVSTVICRVPTACGACCTRSPQYPRRISGISVTSIGSLNAKDEAGAVEKSQLGNRRGRATQRHHHHFIVVVGVVVAAVVVVVVVVIVVVDVIVVVAVVVVNLALIFPLTYLVVIMRLRRWRCRWRWLWQRRRQRQHACGWGQGVAGF